jgi:ribosomal protein S18 acetylase RimI-like enzyme
MIIRKSTVQDVSDVLEILYENSKWLDSQGIFQWPFAWMKSQENEFIDAVETGNFYIYEELKSIVGVLHLTSKFNSLWHGRDENAFYLSKMAIKRSEANRQIGSRMLEKVEKLALCEGTTRIRLDCVSNNAKLKKYYEKRGFRFMERKTLPEVTLDLYEKHLMGEQGDSGNG